MRRARVCIPDLAHHVTQRGNRRADVFLDTEDRHLYLELVREYFTRYRLRLWAYNLMTNHTHMIVVPETETAMSNALRDTHGTYAAMFNRKYGCTGHLWQARFYSCVLDDEHLWHAVRYVERNPVRAGIIDRAEAYPWSSAAPHVLNVEDRYLEEGLPLVGAVKNWSAWLADGDCEKALKALREATATGRACGSEEFVKQLELRCGHSLKPQKRGRKSRKNTIVVAGHVPLLPGWS